MQICFSGSAVPAGIVADCRSSGVDVDSSNDVRYGEPNGTLLPDRSQSSSDSGKFGKECESELKSIAVVMRRESRLRATDVSGCHF